MDPRAPSILPSGLVSVCVDRPLLSLDRPFTYALPEGLTAGIGSLVSVPFHGRPVKGWILGPAGGEAPARVLDVSIVHSEVRSFDGEMLALLRWVSERYVAPLAAVIARSHPPRVVAEETAREGAAHHVLTGLPSPIGGAPPTRALAVHRNGGDLLDGISSGGGAFVLRPVPELEVDVTVEAVLACLSTGRNAIVLVPEARPIPETALAISEAVGERSLRFLGGNRRERYGMWLDIATGRYRCVIGTRPAVFAPLRDVGLIWVSRENHSGHREERSPYYHVRDVASQRVRSSGGVLVLSDLCPSVEAIASGAAEVSPASRSWPPVEVVKPGPEGRAPRLVTALKSARRGFLFEPQRGYGVAIVCRNCGEPAGCRACGGTLRSEGGRVACGVCGAEGVCSSCGSGRFGLHRGGAERVEEWARAVASAPVRAATAATPPGSREGISVGGADAVKDVGSPELDLVGILDADGALRRPGVGAADRALAVWMRAVAWARPGGHAIVQTRRPNEPAVQALVAGNPERFHRAEMRLREEAGFPAGHPVFRVAGGGDVEARIRALVPVNMVSTTFGGETICLVTIHPDEVIRFGATMRALSGEGIVTRVAAEPHL